MSTITATFRGKAVIEAATTPTIYNVSVPLANTEVSQALNPATKMFTIKTRGIATLQLAFNPGDSGTLFLTVPAGAAYTQEGLNFSGIIYLQTSKAGQVVEILEWV